MGAWSTLHRLFASQTQSRLMQVHYHLSTLKKGSSNISDYYQKFQGLTYILATMNQTYIDFEMISFILARLGYEYDPFVTSVTTQVEPLSLEELYGNLLTHESQLEQNQSTALDLPLVGANLACRGYSYQGNRGGHSSPNNTSSG
jgi:hypothetical protein